MNVMKKMNRSQSSYRQCKTLVNEEDSQAWASRLHSRNNSRAQISIGHSFVEADKENNSLFQSVSERNFPKANPVTEFDPTQEVLKQLQQKCKRQEEELKHFYQEKEEQMRGSSRSVPFNYSEKYYQSQIDSLKNQIRKKDQELELYRQQQVSRHEEMDSIASEMESKMEKDSRDKNLLVKELNQKTIEVSHLQERVKIHRSQIETLKLYIREKDQTLRQFEDKIGQADMKKKKIDSYETQIKERDDFLKDLEVCVQKLKEETQKKEIKIEEKSSKINQLEQTVESYEDKLRSMEYNLIKIKEDSKIMSERNLTLTEEVEDWKKSYDELLVKSESNQQFQIKLRTYQNMLEDANKKNMELMSANEKYKISIGSLQKTLAKSQDLEKELSTMKKELKEKQQKIMEFQVREKDYKHLNECFTRTRKEKDQFFARLQEKIKENKTLTLQLEESKINIASLEEELEEIESDNIRGKDQRQKMDILMKENDRLNTLVLEKVGDIEKLQIKLNSMDNRINEKNNQNMKLKSLINDRDQEVNEARAEIEDIRQRCQIETTNRLLNQQKISKCNQQILTQRSLIEKIAAQNKQYEIQMQETRERHQQELKEMKQIISELDLQKKQTEALFEESKQNTSYLKKQVQECKQIIEEAAERQRIHKAKFVQIEKEIKEMTNDRERLLSEKKQIIQKSQQLKQVYDFIMKFQE